MIRVRLPPVFMVATPSSQPLITWPAPRGKLNGWLRSREESNFLPFLPLSSSQPVYWTVTCCPALGSGPVPTTSSWYFRPDGRVTVSALAAAVMAINAAPAMRGRRGMGSPWNRRRARRPSKGLLPARAGPGQGYAAGYNRAADRVGDACSGRPESREEPSDFGGKVLGLARQLG